MAESSNDSAMRRKAGAGRAPPEIGRVDAMRVLRAALAQGAEDALGLTANAIKVSENRTALTAFIETLPESALLTLVEGPNDQFGMVVLDPQSLAAVIEVQTTGRVVPNPAKSRAPTRTDALLANGFIDQVLTSFEDGALEAELEISRDISGYRYQMPMADIRVVTMTMPDIPYRVFELHIDYSDGAKTGIMLILLPYQVTTEQGADANAAWHVELGEVVKCAQVEMDAILARKEMLLSEVANFEIGTIIPLPREVVSRIKLEDINGVGITLGRLGQAGGNRAVCISKPCNLVDSDAPDFDEDGADEFAGGGLGIGDLGNMAATDMPALADIASAPDLADLSDISGELPAGSVPELPELPELPDLPDLAGGGDLPDLAALGDLPDLPAAGGLPDLGDLPDLSSLGDATGLPDLEGV